MEEYSFVCLSQQGQTWKKTKEGRNLQKHLILQTGLCFFFFIAEVCYGSGYLVTSHM